MNKENDLRPNFASTSIGKPKAEKEVETDKRPSLTVGPPDDAVHTRPHLLDDDIEGRRGNYIITFGAPTSGKTTFQSFLLRYLFQHGPFATETMHEVGSSAGPNYESNRIITQWMDQWNKGTFPQSTPTGEGQVREISVRVTPLEGIKTSLELGMLEVSGEMISSVIPTEVSTPSMSRVVQTYLSNPNINLAIILLVNPNDDDNDTLFLNLLTYLDANLPYDVRQRAGLAVLVSKPDAALTRLKKVDHSHQYRQQLLDDSIEDFVEKFCPHTYRFWDQWPDKKKMIGRVYIGETEGMGATTRLVRPDFSSVHNIFSWLYTHFTSRKLGPRLHEKLWAWIKR